MKKTRIENFVKFEVKDENVTVSYDSSDVGRSVYIRIDKGRSCFGSDSLFIDLTELKALINTLQETEKTIRELK